MTNIIDASGRFEFKRLMDARNETTWTAKIGGREHEFTDSELEWFSKNGVRFGLSCRKALAIHNGEHLERWPCSGSPITFPLEAEPGALFSDAWQEQNKWPWASPLLVRVLKVYQGPTTRRNGKGEPMVLYADDQ